MLTKHCAILIPLLTTCQIMSYKCISFEFPGWRRVSISNGVWEYLPYTAICRKGSIALWLAFPLPHPAALGLIPESFSWKSGFVVKFYQRHGLLNLIYLVLAPNCKLAQQQKKTIEL